MYFTTANPKRRRKANFANNDFNNVLNHFLNDTINTIAASAPAQTRPAANIKETAEAFLIDLAIPGLSKKDITLKVEKNVLLIEAKKEVETKEGETIKRTEFNYNEFKRNFQLPETVDTTSVKAAFKNGVLSITLPKKEEAAPRNINIL